MPTYDYKCTECGHRFEEFHKMNEKIEIKCPKCGEKATKQISLNSGLIFKGSGFYITDYKKSHTSSSETKKTEEKPTSKAEKKPESTKNKTTQKSVPKEK